MKYNINKLFTARPHTMGDALAYAAFMLCALCVAFVSCDDIVTYNDNYDDGMTSHGSPVISAIYDVQDTARANSLTEGDLQQMLRIEGENLSNVKSITFNGIEVPVSGVYAKAKACYLTIPRIIPTDVTNKLVYTTQQGTVTRDFVVNIPSIKFNGLVNEFALPGDTVQVDGSYFDLYGFGTDAKTATAHITMDGKEVAVDSLTADYMSIAIPATAKDNSLITFSWTAVGGVQKSVNIPYRQTQCLLFEDLSKVGFWSASSLAYVTDGTAKGDPEMLYGPYFRFKGTFSAWSWNSFGMGFNFSNDDAVSNPGNYVFRFEVNSASASPFYDSGASWGYLFSINDGGNYVWNPSAAKSFNTYGKWKTVSIALPALATNGLKVGWINFNPIMQPNADWAVDHSFANFRIEKCNF